MKTPSLAVLGIALAVLLSGCLVRSANPWLGDDTKIAAPSLAGAWHDEAQGMTLFFTPGEENGYKLLAVTQGKETASFIASLHKVDGALLLDVGPVEQGGLAGFAQMPAHMLFKVDWQTNAMQFLTIDMESAGARIAASPVGKFAAGDKEKSYILLDETSNLTAFVKAQLQDPAFFNPKPLYRFTRIGGE